MESVQKKEREKKNGRERKKKEIKRRKERKGRTEKKVTSAFWCLVFEPFIHSPLTPHFPTML